MNSIRRRLTLKLLLGAGVVALLAGGSHDVLIRRTLWEDFDHLLAAEADSLATQLEFELEGLEFSYEETLSPRDAGGSDARYLMIWSDGEVRFRTPSLQGHDLPQVAGPISTPRFFSTRLPNGEEGRAAGIRFPMRAGAGIAPVLRQLGRPTSAEVTLVCARSARHVHETIATVRRGLLLAGAILCIGIVFVVRRVVRRTTHPIEELKESIARLDVDAPDPRGLELRCPEELEPIRRATEHFVARIAEALEREKRITSNVAHELRTPVAELKSVVDLAHRWPEDEQLLRRSLGECAGIADEMESVVAACLRLARLQSAAARPQREAIDLRGVVEAQLQRLRNRLAEMEISDALVDATILGDRGLCELAIGNLLDNAIEYSRSGSVIEVALTTDEGAELRIANRPRVLPDAERLQSFLEPFWREDSAREGAPHAGLGLALVNEAAKALEVQFSLRLEGERIVASLRWPTREASVSRESTEAPVAHP